ncbi:MAG TPA: TetR/AcrR family transcriptional regulator [Solirubrobacteraceae bacterium]|jgi:AcrR family transcriptional regulator
MATTKASATRTTILELAAQIASTEGLEGLTIGRLAGELRMSKSGLFAHFGSKQELQIATIQVAAARFYGEVIAPTLGEPEGPARLRGYCESYLDYMQREVFTGGCFWAAVASEFDDRPGPVRDAIRDGLSGWLAELERQARIAGAHDPAALAFEIYSLGLGANTYSRLLTDEAAFDRARKAIERRLLVEQAST